MSYDNFLVFLQQLGWRGRTGRYLYITRENGVRLRISLQKRIARMDKVRADGFIYLTSSPYKLIELLPGDRIRFGSLILEKSNVDGMGTKGQPAVL